MYASGPHLQGRTLGNWTCKFFPRYAPESIKPFEHVHHKAGNINSQGSALAVPGRLRGAWLSSLGD